VLFGLDYLLWLFSLGGSRGALGMVAGPLLVILGCTLLWLVIKEAARALAARTLRARGSDRAGNGSAARYRDDGVATSVIPEGGASPGSDKQTAADSGSRSSAQIAA
jgi:hypothetical protein